MENQMETLLNKTIFYNLLIMFVFINSFCSNQEFWISMEGQLFTFFESRQLLVNVSVQKIDTKFHITRGSSDINCITYAASENTFGHKLLIDKENKKITILARHNEPAQTLSTKLNMAFRAYVELFSKSPAVSIESSLIGIDAFVGAMERALDNDNLLLTSPAAKQRHSQAPKLTINFSVHSAETIGCFKLLTTIATALGKSIAMRSTALSNRLDAFLNGLAHESESITDAAIDDYIKQFNTILDEFDRQVVYDSSMPLFSYAAFFTASLLTEGYYAYKDYQTVGSLKKYVTHGLFFQFPHNRFAQAARIITKVTVVQGIWDLFKPAFYRLRQYFLPLFSKKT